MANLRPLKRNPKGEVHAALAIKVVVWGRAARLPGRFHQLSGTGERSGCRVTWRHHDSVKGSRKITDTFGVNVWLWCFRLRVRGSRPPNRVSSGLSDRQTLLSMLASRCWDIHDQGALPRDGLLCSGISLSPMHGYKPGRSLIGGRRKAYWGSLSRTVIPSATCLCAWICLNRCT